MATEASEIEREIERAAESLPPPETLAALARRRLARELRALPSEGSAAWRAALLAEAPAGASLGALAHAIRASARAGRMDEARELFVALLRRTDGLNRRWVATALRGLPGAPDERRERAQDLAQELALALWRRVGLGDDPAWELFFQRALDFTQRKVATTWLRRQGLRADPRVERAERGLALVFSQFEENAPETALPVEPEAATLASADLADLRALVQRLPERERLAVVMRYWQRAGEAEIAAALGVTTRATRYILRRAYRRLRLWYAGASDEGASDE
ncbi:MAG TPA: sigma-70 family RNA polymerase sigma factor [Ktedonobacterales bacterium]